MRTAAFMVCCFALGFGAHWVLPVAETSPAVIRGFCEPSSKYLKCNRPYIMVNGVRRCPQWVLNVEALRAKKGG